VRPARRQRGHLSPVNLREVYQLPGEYSVKMLIDAKTSAETESVTVRMLNADGSPFPVNFRRWGTKLTLSFVIDESVPDGVVIIDVTMRAKTGEVTAERFSVWVIK
jgi:hypothetical protein